MTNEIYVISPETREKLKQSQLGKKMSLETREKMRQSTLKRYEDPEEREKTRQSLLGKKHTIERREKSRQSHNRPESIEKNKQSHLGKKRTSEQIEKNKQAQLVAQNRPDVKEKQRKAILKNIEKNYGVAIPSYNPKSCEYFKQFDIEHNTIGRYAVYGNGEYLIKELGYFPDYINFDLKLIIEWDEERHYENGVLSECDVQRQKEIQEHFPDFEFKRIREKEIKCEIILE